MSDESTAVQVIDNGALVALNRAEIDMHIATAKKYPRNIIEAVHKMEGLIQADPEVAEKAYYVLDFFKDENGKAASGPSIRIAEMAASQWGNLRYGSRPFEWGDKTVTAQGFCYDLETNTYYTSEKSKSIVGKNGKRYAERVVVTTMLACQAIAERDAIFKVIPKAYANKLVELAKSVAAGTDAADMKKKLDIMIAWFQKQHGVKQEDICAYLGVLNVEDITREDVIQLRGIANAIKDGHQTVQDVFYGGTREGVETGTITPEDLKPAAEQTVRPAEEPPAKEEPKPSAAAPTDEEVKSLVAEIKTLRDEKGVDGRAWMGKWKKAQGEMTPQELVAAYTWLQTLPDKAEGTPTDE